MAISPSHPDAPEPELPTLPTSIPDEDIDHPSAQEIIARPTTVSGDGLTLPPVILGCAPFGYGIYTDQDKVVGDLPVRMVRLALRAGMTAFDTAPHYHPSEVILGRALYASRDEFPRESYTIITKTAKFGGRLSDHIYEPAMIRRSIERSLKRFHTDYLDVVYLHDVEFAVDSPMPTPSGRPIDALSDLEQAKIHHLHSPYSPRGPGDESIIASLGELRKLQQEGKIRKVGIAGYPLPLLLRIARMIKETTGKPLDILQCYAHQTLLNTALEDGYLAAFEEAGVGQVINAAPLAMGILTTHGGPDWHFARHSEGGRIFKITREAVEYCQAKEGGLTIEEAASDFGYKALTHKDGKIVPVVIGCSNLQEIKRTLESYARVVNGKSRTQGLAQELRNFFKEKGADGWSWESPGAKAFE